MSKTKELVTIVVPGVAFGLLAMGVTGALPAACLPRAVTMAVVLLSTLALISASVDAARSLPLMCDDKC